MKKPSHNIWKVACGLLSILLLCCDPEDPSPQNETPIDEEPLITATGSPNGQASSAFIGTPGGELHSADGYLTVTIPNGALSSTTNIVIQPISNEAPLGLGNGYRLQPEGIQFAKPVKLTFHYNDQLLDESPEDFLWIVTQGNDGAWNAALKAVTDKAAKTVVIETSHFSDWSLGRFINLSLDPVNKVLLKKQSVSLQVTGFSKGSSTDDDELAPLPAPGALGEGLTPLTPIPPVESRLTSFKIKQWTLNGVAAPVSNSNGSLQLTDRTASYTAPDKVPSANPVAVSVELETSNKEGKKSAFILTSNITIVEGYFLTVTLDGTKYEYFQYGFDSTLPPDPDNLAIANCGLDDDNILSLGGTYVMNSTNVVNGFGLQFQNPVKGTGTFRCYLDDGNDDMAFSIGDLGGGYELSYTKRTKNGDICDVEQLCGVASLTLTDYTNEARATVAGHFSGTLYESKPEFSDQCKTSIAHSVEGSFVLKRAN